METIAAETAEIAALKATENTIETVIINSAKVSASKAVEKIAVKSSKEIVEAGIKEGTKIMVGVGKSSFITVASEGGEQIIAAGTKESVKVITETIVIKQGGKSWLINLGKAVPFIGAGISAFINTFSTAKLGKKLIDKFNGEFYYNKQRQVNLLRGRIRALLNIIEQMLFIQDEQNMPQL